MFYNIEMINFKNISILKKGILKVFILSVFIKRANLECFPKSNNLTVINNSLPLA